MCGVSKFVPNDHNSSMCLVYISPGSGMSECVRILI
jgi:hypothetical protein